MAKAKKRNQKTFKTAVSEMARRLRWHVYANAYRMDIIWAINTYGPAGPTGGNVAAEIKIDYSYLTLELTIYRTLYNMYQDGKPIFPHLVHEFVHFITMPMYQRAYAMTRDTDMECLLKEMHERETETIARMLCSEGDESVLSVKKYDR